MRMCSPLWLSDVRLFVRVRLLVCLSVRALPPPPLSSVHLTFTLFCASSGGQWQGLEGVIFHDSFSESFVREYSSERIRFVNVLTPEYELVGERGVPSAFNHPSALKFTLWGLCVAVLFLSDDESTGVYQRCAPVDPLPLPPSTPGQHCGRVPHRLVGRPLSAFTLPGASVGSVCGSVCKSGEDKMCRRTGEARIGKCTTLWRPCARMLLNGPVCIRRVCVCVCVYVCVYVFHLCRAVTLSHSTASLAGNTRRPPCSWAMTT
jgi:hypothetical protein